jgi:hypothetical protein
MTLAVDERTLGWDVGALHRLWEESSVPVRKLLKHLHCYPDREETMMSVAEYVECSDRSLRTLVDELEKHCERRYGRPLPFARRDLNGYEMYCMPEPVARMVFQVY